MPRQRRRHQRQRVHRPAVSPIATVYRNYIASGDRSSFIADLLSIVGGESSGRRVDHFARYYAATMLLFYHHYHFFPSSLSVAQQKNILAELSFVSWYDIADEHFKYQTPASPWSAATVLVELCAKAWCGQMDWQRLAEKRQLLVKTIFQALNAMSNSSLYRGCAVLLYGLFADPYGCLGFKSPYDRVALLPAEEGGGWFSRHIMQLDVMRDLADQLTVKSVKVQALMESGDLAPVSLQDVVSEWLRFYQSDTPSPVY